jgi:glycosyltransferase involved in cell wall biosynthesis
MYHMQLVRFIWPDVRLFGLVHGFLPVEFPPPHAGHVIRRYDRFFASTLETQTFLKLRFEVDAPVLGNLFDRELFWGPGRAQLEGHAHRVLFLGTLTANKTLPLRALLAALPQMPETDLHVAGAGDELQELKQLALKLGVAERVVWCGLLPDPRDEIRAAGVVIGAGRAAIESASSGTPVVVATSDGLAGVLRPSNVERFAAANFTGRAKGRREVSPTSIQEAVVAARSMSDSDRMAVAARLDDVGDIGILLSALAGN